jgi:hypothetical protein
VKVDLSKLDDAALVKLQLHKNDWYVRHARRLLQERATAGKLSPAVRPTLLKILQENQDLTRQLRALWALHAIGGIDEPLTLALLANPQERLRSWAIRLAVDAHDATPALLSRFAVLAKDDPSPVVRLALASAMQKLSLAQRWSIAEALIAHGEDAADQNLPLMYWYGIDALAPADSSRAAGLIAKAKIPLIREYLARQIAGLGE